MSMDYNFYLDFKRKGNVSKQFEAIKNYDNLHGNVIRDHANGVEYNEDGTWDIPYIMNLSELITKVQEAISEQSMI